MPRHLKAIDPAIDGPAPRSSQEWYRAYPKPPEAIETATTAAYMSGQQCGKTTKQEREKMRRALDSAVLFQDENCGRCEFHAIPYWQPIFGRRYLAAIASNLRRNHAGLVVILNELHEDKAFEYWQGIR